MPVPPVGVVDPSFLTTGPEWQVAPVDPAAQAASGGGFAGALGQAVESLQADQTAASQAVQGLATGTSTDQAAAVMALERAQLSMQLASQIRTKATEAFSDVFHTQV
jgi:flagellar hook-basal body complex protein FliE